MPVLARLERAAAVGLFGISSLTSLVVISLSRHGFGSWRETAVPNRANETRARTRLSAATFPFSLSLWPSGAPLRGLGWT
jgi:hypothetical protein